MARKNLRYIDKISSLLKDAGYRAVVDDTDPVINSSANGLNFIVVVYNEDALQFHCSIEIEEPSNNFLYEINKRNSNYRYMKIFYDFEGKQLALQSDYFYDAYSKNAKVIFERMIQIFDAALTNLKELTALYHSNLEKTVSSLELPDPLES